RTLDGMNPFAHYLELVATVQYLHGRGHVFGGDEDAFYLGSKAAMTVVLAHALTLTAIAELSATALQLPESFRLAARLTIFGLAMALYAFLQTNSAYLQALREHLSQEPGGSGNRERSTCAFVVSSWLLAV